MRKLIAPVAALLCGAALHCNMGTGPGPAGNPDLGPGPGGGDGGMTQGALTGTQIDTVITEAGEAPQPHDLSGEQIAALVPNPDGHTFRIYPGAGKADGSFTVPGVPVGTYYLGVNGRFVVSAARHLDLGQALQGRQDRVRPTQATLMLFTADGMAPWTINDHLYLYAANVGAYDRFTDAFAGHQPMPGDTGLNLMTTDWSHATDPYLIRGSEGDHLLLLQLSGALSDKGTTYQTLRSMFTAPAFDQKDGQTSTLSGHFMSVATPLSTSYQWPRSQYAALRTQVSPMASAASHTLVVSAYPGAAAHGDYGAGAPLVALYPAGDDDVSTGKLPYGDPFPASWSVVVSATTTFQVPYQLPELEADTISLSVYQVALDKAQGGKSLDVAVGPVQHPQINGQDAFMRQGGAGTSPVLTWEKPAVGQATAYEVRLYHLYENSGYTRRALQALLITTDTRLVIPPGQMSPGLNYAVLITSLSRPGTDSTAAPFRRSLPEGGAQVWTANLSP